jgi:hypothetical protein
MGDHVKAIADFTKAIESIRDTPLLTKTGVSPIVP